MFSQCCFRLEVLITSLANRQVKILAQRMALMNVQGSWKPSFMRLSKYQEHLEAL